MELTLEEERDSSKKKTSTQTIFAVHGSVKAKNQNKNKRKHAN